MAQWNGDGLRGAGPREGIAKVGRRSILSSGMIKTPAGVVIVSKFDSANCHGYRDEGK